MEVLLVSHMLRRDQASLDALVQAADAIRALPGQDGRRPRMPLRRNARPTTDVAVLPTVDASRQPVALGGILAAVDQLRAGGRVALPPDAFGGLPLGQRIAAVLVGVCGDLFGDADKPSPQDVLASRVAEGWGLVTAIPRPLAPATTQVQADK
jgi:hypothetical protein